MNTSTKISSLITGLGLSLCMLGAAQAQTAPTPPPPPAAPQAGPAHHGPHRDMAKKLNLSPEQASQYEQVMRRAHERREASREQTRKELSAFLTPAQQTMLDSKPPHPPRPGQARPPRPMPPMPAVPPTGG